MSNNLIRAILHWSLLFSLRFFDGFVLSVLCGWFVSPVFRIPPLSIIQATGVVLVVVMVAAITSDAPEQEEIEEKFEGYTADPVSFWKHLIKFRLSMATTVLLMAWVIHLFL